MDVIIAIRNILRIIQSLCLNVVAQVLLPILLEDTPHLPHLRIEVPLPVAEVAALEVVVLVAVERVEDGNIQLSTKHKACQLNF